MLIYIAGPISGPPAKKKAHVIAAIAASIDLIHRGHNPYIPHLRVAVDDQATVQDRPIEYETWMRLDDEWLQRCVALLYLEHSPGADRELARAKELGLKIYTSTHDVPMESMQQLNNKKK